MYVSHRVEEIQTWSLGDPGRLNPADVATRSILEEEALPSKWWEGPKFLRSLKEEWPKDLPWMVVLEEIRPIRIFQTTFSLATLDWVGVKINVEDLHSEVKWAG